MTNPEIVPYQKRFKTWQLIIGALIFLAILGQLFGGKSSDTASTSSTSSTSSVSHVDSGTHMACEHWRINLSNASVETTAQQISGAQQVNKYASVSDIPAIVSNAKAMTEAMINQDSEAYLTYGTAFGNACQAVGE